MNASHLRNAIQSQLGEPVEPLKAGHLQAVACPVHPTHSVAQFSALTLLTQSEHYHVPPWTEQHGSALGAQALPVSNRSRRCCIRRDGVLRRSLRGLSSGCKRRLSHGSRRRAENSSHSCPRDDGRLSWRTWRSYRSGDNSTRRPRRSLLDEPCCPDTLPRVKVFISWSGEQSRQIALALYEWLPQTVQSAQPYMSEKGNEAGVLWDQILASNLEESNFGIICLTPANLESRWINFEAGALSKAVTQSRVVPLLYGLDNNDVGLPLSRFMMKRADKMGVWETVVAMNSHVGEDRRLPESVLSGTFESLWPKLEERFNAVSAGPEARRRSDRELLEEILDLVRSSNSPILELSQGMSPVALQMADIRKILQRIAGPNGHVEIGKNMVVVRLPKEDLELMAPNDLVVVLMHREIERKGMQLRVLGIPGNPDDPD